MTTKSQLVDKIVRELHRNDIRDSISTYCDQTIRELHFDARTNGAIMYEENLREVRLTANVDAGFGWDIPDSAIFQALQAVRFDSCGTYPKSMVPGRALFGLEKYYYRAGSQYAFSGYGGTNQTISLAYFEFPKKLRYYPAGSRPAEYDPDLGWTYAPEFDDTPELQLAAQGFTTNWLLLRWDDVIAEGMRAKAYKRVSDDGRARTCYSLYQSLRVGLQTSETADLGGYA